MKKILIIILCIFGVSCSVSKTHRDYLAVYVHYGEGTITPTEYIILKIPYYDYIKSYESYTGNSGSVYGDWTISNDTLFLNPKYERIDYGEKSQEINLIDKTADLDVSTVPRQFLMKENVIMDITKYHEYFPILSPVKPVEYKRLRWNNISD